MAAPRIACVVLLAFMSCATRAARIESGANVSSEMFPLAAVNPVLGSYAYSDFSRRRQHDSALRVQKSVKWVPPPSSSQVMRVPWDMWDEFPIGFFSGLCALCAGCVWGLSASAVSSRPGAVASQEDGSTHERDASLFA